MFYAYNVITAVSVLDVKLLASLPTPLSYCLISSDVWVRLVMDRLGVEERG
jgi:hypothetical protein